MRNVNSALFQPANKLCSKRTVRSLYSTWAKRVESREANGNSQSDMEVVTDV